MERKHKMIISKLLEKQTLTSNELSQSINLSVRTIKTLIKEINTELPGTIISSNQGYTLVKKDSITQISSFSDITDYEKRKNQIILSLLSATTPLNIFDLAEEMFVSISTLHNELKNVKSQLSSFDLKLVSRNSYLHIEGLEKNKRKLISDMLYRQSNIDFMNYSTIQKLFPDIEITLLKNIVTAALEAKRYFINDYSLVNFILHLTIMIKRMKQKNYTQENIDSSIIEKSAHEICVDIAYNIEHHFHISFSESEITELQILLVSRATKFNIKDTNKLEIKKYIGSEANSIINLIVKKLSEYYYIDLDPDSEFGIRFSIHIKNLLIRAQNNYLSKNPLAENIKSQSPLIYDISVTIASVIKQATNLTINDDEIAYIAFHIGSIIENQRKLTKSIRGVLYCPEYYEISKELATQLTNQFGDSLFITNIINDEEQLSTESNIELVVTTVPLNKSYPISVQQISLFFNHSDQNKIRVALEKIYLQHKRKYFKNKLEELITPSLFEISTSNTNKDDVIKHMSDNLYKLGYTQKNYYEKVLERELLSSTEFDYFAIPHTMKMESKKTGIYLLINRKGIVWNNKKINVVIMLCFSPSERSLFNEIFGELTEILLNPKNVSVIVKSNNYEELIENIVNCIE